MVDRSANATSKVDRGKVRVLMAPNVVRQPRGAALAPDTAFCGARAGGGLSDARVRCVKVDHLSFPPSWDSLDSVQVGRSWEECGMARGFLICDYLI